MEAKKNEIKMGLNTKLYFSRRSVQWLSLMANCLNCVNSRCDVIM